MKITAIMPVHNAALHAVTAAYQIIDNLFCVEAEWQLILIDDNSETVDKEILCELESVEPGIHLYHTEDFISTPSPNLGWNINLGMDQVTPEDDYLLIVESDVYLEPFCLRNLIQAGKEVAIPQFFSRCKRLSTHSYPGCPANVPIDELPQTILTQQTVKWGHLGCMLLKGDIARDTTIRIEADKFRLWYADFDLCGQIKAHGHEITYVPSAHVRHRGNVSSHSGPQGPIWPGVMSPDEARGYVYRKWGLD